MTPPQDPRKHPLQDDEVALARVLRALPSGEPPASVDDAILRAATDAVSPGRRKPAPGLRWLPTWAIGTAAAAVLAVGIGIQLRPPLNREAAPASVSETVKPLPQARERMSVDLVEPDQAAAPPPASAPPQPRRAIRTAPPPPPPPPPAIAPAPQAAAEAEAFPAPAAPPAPPAETADPSAAEEAAAPAAAAEQRETRLRSEATDQARRAHQESYARRAQSKAAAQAPARQDQAGDAAASGANRTLPQVGFTAPAPAPAPAPVADAPAAAAAPVGEALADAAATADILPPVAEDARLAPDDWLDRIRERRRQGDSAGARASLRLFVQAHPEAPVPSDLARLR